MIRSHIFIASLSVAMLVVLPGCGKKNEETKNPDDVAGDGSSTDGQGSDDAASKPSRARKTTATRGASGSTKARTMTAKKPPRAPGGGGGTEPTPDEGPNGLIAEAWQLSSLTALPDFASLKPAEARIVLEDVNVGERDFTEGFPGLAMKENYALRLSGSINIEAEAEYELCLNADDGAQLLLENTLVVDNDGVHDAVTEACEVVYLAPGEYLLEIRYFQASGPTLALQFAWAIDGGSKELVPSAVLFKPAE